MGDVDLHGARRVRFREGGTCGLTVLRVRGELFNYYGFHVRNVAG